MVIDYEHSETQLQQTLAANKILMEALNQDRKDRRITRRVSIICASICVVVLLLFAGVMGILAAGVTIETTTEETTQSVEGDSAIINNSDFEQYNDNAVNGGNN